MLLSLLCCSLWLESPPLTCPESSPPFSQSMLTYHLLLALPQTPLPLAQRMKKLTASSSADLLLCTLYMHSLLLLECIQLTPALTPTTESHP